MYSGRRMQRLFWPYRCMKGETIFLPSTLMSMVFSVSRVPTKYAETTCYAKKIKEVCRGEVKVRLIQSWRRFGNPTAQTR